MLSFRSRIGLGIVVGIIVGIGVILSALGRADRGEEAARPVTLDDRIKDEPVRPKASEPIRFLDSLAEAATQANARKQRILVFYTNMTCSTCRTFEARTLNDAEVVDLGRKYVCVKLQIGRDAALADLLHLKSTPQSIVLLPDGSTVDEQVGYVPATDFASWLAAALVKPPTGGPKPLDLTPPPVGTSEAKANLTMMKNKAAGAASH